MHTKRTLFLRENDSPVELIEIDDGSVEISAIIGSGKAVAAKLSTQRTERQYADLLKEIRRTPGKTAFISWIASNEPGKGAGSAALDKLLRLFDDVHRVGTTFLQLSSARGIAGNDVARREQFFMRHGFEPDASLDSSLPRRAMHRTAHFVRTNESNMPEGRSRGLNTRDFDPIALRLGTAHELEHTTDTAAAQRIAMDHLVEHPTYYSVLPEMERQMSRREAQGHRQSGHYGEFPSKYVEFPREIAEQVRALRPALWQRHGTGGDPPTAWTGDNAYKAWEWWIALREGRTPPSSDIPVAKKAWQILTSTAWAGPDAILFESVVDRWLTKKRENYITRHAKDHQPGGTIAMIKWAGVFPWAEQDAPGAGYTLMLDTLGLVDDNGTVREKKAARPNTIYFRVR